MEDYSIKNLYDVPTRRLANVISSLHLKDHTFLMLLAGIVGVLAGFAALGIRFLITQISVTLFPGNGTILENIIASPWYFKLFFPAIGGLIIGPIIYFFAKEAKGHGVPRVVQAVLRKGGLIRPVVGFVKAIVSSFAIGTGSSVGREGPLIQVGASIASTIGQILKIPGPRLKVLAGCGAAAGLSAAFNAPIAGAVFAAEIILMEFTFTSFLPIIISSFAASVVVYLYDSGFLPFGELTFNLVSYYELIWFLLLGAVTGVLAVIFTRSLRLSEKFLEEKVRIPEWIYPAIGGLFVGAIALYMPNVMGTGYGNIPQLLSGEMVIKFILLFILLKLAATVISIGAGSSGGIISPNLVLGAFAGYAFGLILNFIYPENTSSPASYALIGMAAMLSGSIHAPLSAVVILFELTGNYAIIPPALAGALASYLTAMTLYPDSGYSYKLTNEKINIENGLDINILKLMEVKDVVSDKFSVLFINDNFNQVVEKIIRGRGPDFPVVDQAGEINGIISIYDIKDYLIEKDSLQDLLIAGDISNNHFEVLSPSDNCLDALNKIRMYNMEGLPVVDRSRIRKVAGMIWKHDIHEAYRKEVERLEVGETLSEGISLIDEKKSQFMQGYMIVEINPPNIFLGKTISELNLKARYGVDIISVKKQLNKHSKENIILPKDNYEIKMYDSLVVAGETKALSMLQNMDRQQLKKDKMLKELKKLSKTKS